MGCISVLIALLNLVILIAASVALWSFSAAMGIYGFCGVAMFIVVYLLSNSMAISPLDRFISPEFGVFMKRLIYANTSAFVVWGGIVIVTNMLGWESSVEFMKWITS